MRNAVCALLVLLTLVPIAHADTPPGAGTQRVPLGDGRTLTVSAPKQLTFNARIETVFYQPRHPVITYSGTETHGDTQTEFVRLVDVNTGHITTLLSVTGQAQRNIAPFAYLPNEWSNDGRYLMAAHTEHTAATDTTPENDGLV